MVLENRAVSGSSRLLFSSTSLACKVVESLFELHTHNCVLILSLIRKPRTKKQENKSKAKRKEKNKQEYKRFGLSIIRLPCFSFCYLYFDFSAVNFVFCSVLHLTWLNSVLDSDSPVEFCEVLGFIWYRVGLFFVHGLFLVIRRNRREILVKKYKTDVFEKQRRAHFKKCCITKMDFFALFGMFLCWHALH